MDNIYDVIIIGAGPAGLAAAIYAGRSRMKAMLIEKAFEGGQLALTADIENYPGSHIGDTGPELIGRMVAQVEHFGVERAYDIIVDVELEGEIKTLKGAEKEYRASTIIIATGAFPKLIGCPGEKEFTGRGVSYCATCDGAFYRDLEVFVVGGGDSAVEEAIYLTRFAKKVTIVHRRDELRAARSIQEHARNNPKIEYLWDSVVEEIKGEHEVNSVSVRNVKTNEITDVKVDGIFVCIGLNPSSALFDDKIKMENGYIVADEMMQTNVEGVFVAGDIRVKPLRQVVTAVSDGAIAAMQVYKYLFE